jgi:hypothetical protein
MRSEPILPIFFLISAIPICHRLRVVVPSSAMSGLFPRQIIASHSKHPFSHTRIALIATHSEDSRRHSTPSINPFYFLGTAARRYPHGPIFTFWTKLSNPALNTKSHVCWFWWKIIEPSFLNVPTNHHPPVRSHLFCPDAAPTAAFLSPVLPPPFLFIPCSYQLINCVASFFRIQTTHNDKCRYETTHIQPCPLYSLPPHHNTTWGLFYG